MKSKGVTPDEQRFIKATMEAAKRVDDDGGEEVSRESLDLPLNIITEIILRLPAKSIGRFRCVSKLFYSLSSDPGFVKSHLERTNHRKIIVSSYNLFSLDVDSIGDGCERGKRTRELVAAVELNYPLKDYWILMKSVSRRNWVTIVGSSNGLVCIGISIESNLRKYCVFLFNPTTGDSKRLPKSPVEEYVLRDAPDGVYGFQTFGFGFDHVTHDYKVVRLGVTSKSNPHVLDASVYSLKANSWRWICSLHYKLSSVFCSRAVHLNGAIHWVVIHVQEHNRNQRVVVAFDLNTEEFREMPLPVEACSHKSFVVSSLNGRLCVVSCYEQHDDMWVMNEYGDAKSWTRIRTSLSFWCMKPQCSTKNDQEFLLDVDGDMVVYNLKTDASRRITIRGLKEGVGFEADTYVESLVSPSSFGKESRGSLLSLKDIANKIFPSVRCR